MIKPSPAGDRPRIHESAYVDPTAVIIGKVRIGRNVFIGPLAVIRSDEPESRIIIDDNCNIQDRVIIHALAGTSVKVGRSASLSHGCIVHGPCRIGKRCFIGFGSVVFNARLGDGVIVKHLAVVEGVNISAGKTVKSCQSVKNNKDTGPLEIADPKTRDFVKRVVITNLTLAKGYRNE